MLSCVRHFICGQTEISRDGLVGRVLAIVGLWLGVASVAHAAADVVPFLNTYCYDCHSASAKEGGLDLTALKLDLAQPQNFAKWERIHDRIVSGEMPPKSAVQPNSAQRAGFVKELARDLTAAHDAGKGTVLRRLNRQEYQNTLNDIFGTNLKLVDRLPEDGRSHEFDNVGEALGISMVQMQRYLDGATSVLDDATQRTLAPLEPKLVKASYADTQGAAQWLGKIWLHRDDGAVVFFRSTSYPSGMLREANVQREGWYKIRVTGYAFQSESPISFSLGAKTFARGVEEPTFGYFAFPPGKPTTIEARAWIPARFMIDVTPVGIHDRNNEIRQNGVKDYKGPGLAVQSIEVEGPFVDEFPTRGHRLVYDGLQRSELPPRNRADRNRPWYVPKFEMPESTNATDIEAALRRVATKAFRRPVAAPQMRPYLSLYNAERAAGSSVDDAYRAAVVALFCSPDFLFLREPIGPLDDYALASRLSYFLARTAPDEPLLAAAAAGTLTRNPAVLAEQTERLLKHPHAARFVADFTDAWLNLRDIDFTNPDGALYPEFDQFLRYSMVEETRMYFRKLVDDNLGVVHVVKSDFAMLNDRLAEHYGIAGVTGPELRPVRLSTDAIRGGFLTQASVLKVSANGSNTSPVVRGVWVMERILGQAPPPPPPGIPGVEPDIRGASTLRELLDKHRKLDSCRGCHQAIDPPGFALESFDPIGSWRDRFRTLGSGERANLEVRGQRVRFGLGPAVDASGELIGGGKFSNFRDFRDLLARDQPRLARALATKFLTFATGREMGFSDRATIDTVVEKTRSSQYGVRDLIQAVVASDAFRRK